MIGQIFNDVYILIKFFLIVVAILVVLGAAFIQLFGL